MGTDTGKCGIKGALPTVIKGGITVLCDGLKTDWWVEKIGKLKRDR